VLKAPAFVRGELTNVRSQQRVAVFASRTYADLGALTAGHPRSGEQRQAARTAGGHALDDGGKLSGMSGLPVRRDGTGCPTAVVPMHIGRAGGKRFSPARTRVVWSPVTKREDQRLERAG